MSSGCVQRNSRAFVQGRLSGAGIRWRSNTSGTSTGTIWIWRVFYSPSGNYPAIATHDEAIIREIVAHCRRNSISADRFEFQMLYGIRRDLQRKLVTDGYRLRLYIPYGEAWYPYFMRRLAERPANLIFLAKNLFRE